MTDCHSAGKCVYYFIAALSDTLIVKNDDFMTANKTVMPWTLKDLMKAYPYAHR